MGNEMYGMAVTRRIVCHHTTNVPVLHVAAETIPRCGVLNGSSYSRIGESRVDGKRLALLFIGCVVEQVVAVERLES